MRAKRAKKKRFRLTLETQRPPARTLVAHGRSLASTAVAYAVKAEGTKEMLLRVCIHSLQKATKTKGGSKTRNRQPRSPQRPVFLLDFVIYGDLTRFYLGSWFLLTTGGWSLGELVACGSVWT